jgi:hypothetical protein
MMPAIPAINQNETPPLRFILRVKVFVYRFVFILQTCLVRIARVIPGVPRALGIPPELFRNILSDMVAK